MHCINQVNHFRSRTYNEIWTLESDKVSKFITTIHSCKVNMNELAHFLDLEWRNHKDRDLNTYKSPGGGQEDGVLLA